MNPLQRGGQGEQLLPTADISKNKKRHIPRIVFPDRGIPATNILSKIECRKRKADVLSTPKQDAEISTVKRTLREIDYLRVQRANYVDTIRRSSSHNPLCIRTEFLYSFYAKLVVFPALSKKEVIIRTPFSNEIGKIINPELYNDSVEDLNKLIQNEGVYFNEAKRWSERMLVLSNPSEGSALLAGVLYVFVENGVRSCWISSIQVREGFSGKGYSFLLFSCIVLDAIEKKCAYVAVNSCPAGVLFYEQFGFCPAGMNIEYWQRYSIEQRIEMLNGSKNIYLTLNNPFAMKTFHEKLRSTLS